MPLDINNAAVRRLDLATFTGDAWAVDATLDLPPSTVPRLIADSSTVRWVALGMSSGSDDATQEADTTTTLSTCLVKISRTSHGNALVRSLAASSGTIVGHEVTEEDVSVKDVFVLAIPTITAGTAPWLWLVPTAGCDALASGVSP